jgi:predicted PhzF superfamily epimerase YddE/YHI9
MPGFFFAALYNLPNDSQGAQMNFPVYQVDAFTDKVFGGNPAAVVPLTSWPDDALLQAIAMENNLSETAYFVRQGDAYALRWFTPLVEVDLCGHATMAAAYVIFHHIEPVRSEITFHTRSGELLVTRNGDRLLMDFPSQPPQPCVCPADLQRGLGKQPADTYRAGGYLAVFDSEDEILALRPESEYLKRLDLPYVIVTAKGTRVDFVSRVFGPKVGIPEDPVTGSSHCALIPYWAQRLGKNMLHARQVSKRGGKLHCELKGDRVEIAGQAVLFMKGEIYL